MLLGLSGLSIVIGFILKFSGAAPIAENLAFLIGTIIGGLLVFPSGLKAIRSMKLNMNALMTVAVSGAWLIGEGADGSVVVLLFAFSEWLESVSAERARKSIRDLLSLAPETALRKSDEGATDEVEASKIKVGETVIVRRGQQIPLDGIVRKGHSSVNQAPITGESAPVDKQPGDGVFAGTVNGEGSFEIEVTKLASDSTLSRIIHLVEEAGIPVEEHQAILELIESRGLSLALVGYLPNEGSSAGTVRRHFDRRLTRTADFEVNN